VSDLTGKVAWIAGAARPPGIGRATAVQLARLGADVACVDAVDDNAAGDPNQAYAVTAAALEATAEAVRAEGRNALVLHVDLADEYAVNQSVAVTVRDLGRIDIGCNLSGGTGPALGNGPLIDLDVDGWQTALDINLTAAWLGSRACARQMIEQGDGGAIVSLSSSAAIAGAAGVGAFSAARAGVNRITEVLATELGPHNIRVNAVCPRGIAPGAVGNPGLVRRAERDSGGLEEWARQTIPLGRLQSADETAAVVVFLASDAASFVSGQSIVVAGGAHV
jgi:NAD(P)-dependent dehydrogenase (short-subunit alcohol dehydrogenase family)